MAIATQNSMINGLVPSTSVNPLVRDIFFVAVGVLLLAVSARTQVPMWPAPVTLQALVVMLLGGVLGWRMGAISVLSYIAIGMAVSASVPWFAHPGYAMYPFVSATAGYLWGFVVAAAVIGLLLDNAGWRSNIALTFVAFMIGNVISYAMGLAFAAAIYYPVIQGDAQSFQNVWVWFAQKFIIGDVLKAVIATGLIFAGAQWLKGLRG